MIRLAGEGTAELLRSMMERAKTEAENRGLNFFRGEEVQIDSELVQVRITRRMGRGGKTVLFAVLWLNGRRRGFNYVRGAIDKDAPWYVTRRK